MKSREDDRLSREKSILISLKGEKNKSSLLELEKHLTKFVRKMLTLTVTDQNETKNNQRAFLIQRNGVGGLIDEVDRLFIRGDVDHQRVLEQDVSHG